MNKLPPSILNEAASASTNVKRLREIYKEFSNEPEIVEALLQNPNSPLDLLVAASRRQPLALIKNVGLHLFFVEDASFMKAFPYEVVIEIARELSTPMWLVEACHLGFGDQISYSGVSLCLALAKRRELSAFLLDELSRCSHQRTWSAYIRRPELSPDAVARGLCSTFQGVRYRASKHPNTPPALLSLMRRAGASDGLERYHAPDLSVTPEELVSLLPMGRFASCLAVKNPNFPPEKLDSAVETYPDCIAGALQNPNAPGSFLAKYAGHSSLIADHPNTPEKLLYNLLISSEDELREVLLNNPSSPPDLVRLIRRTQDKDPTLTDSELQKLSACSTSMKQLALSHPNVSAAWISSCWEEVKRLPVQQGKPYGKLIIAHPNTPAALLKEIIQGLFEALKTSSPSSSITYYSEAMQSLAHPNISPEDLDLIIGNMSSHIGASSVFRHLLDNPSLSSSQLARLIALSPKIKYYTTDFQQRLAKNPKLDASALSSLATAKRSVRALVAQHPNTSAKDLMTLAEDPEPQVRFFAAKNPNMPRDSLQGLIELGATPDLFAVSCRAVPLSNEQLAALRTRGVFSRILAAHACTAEQRDILLLLSDDKHPRVREEVARNPNFEDKRSRLWYASSRYLEAAFAQSSIAVAKRRFPEFNSYLDGDFLLKRSIASNPKTPAVLLRELSSLSWISADLAHNPSTPAALLQQLAKRKELSVQRALVVNPSTPSEVLQSLLQNPLKLPIETARLRIDLATPQRQERDAAALLPVFNSNPEFLWLDEHKSVYTLRDASRYLQGEPQYENSRVLLISRKAPISSRPWIRKGEAACAGDELIATASMIDKNPRDGEAWLGFLLVHAQCHRQGLGEEAMLAIERELYSRGHRALHLAAFQSNTRALAFWQHLGYQIYADATHPNGEQLWKLQKPLTL